MQISAELERTFSRIKLLLMDCDGVLTDGRLYFSETGEAMKSFHVRDGQGISDWHKAGFRSGIVTGRGGEIVGARAKELGIDFVIADSKDKAGDVIRLMLEAEVSPIQTAFIGDDLGDLPAFIEVRMPIAVSDAVDAVKRAAQYVTKTPGGYGAVREVIDLMLHAKQTSSRDQKAGS